MPTLGQLIKDNNIPSTLSDKINSTASDYRQEGYRPKDAQKMAIQDIIAELETSREKLNGC